MYNNNSFSVLKEVTFSENTAQYGGGMYNSASSPVLIGVTFSSNTAAASFSSGSGGAMYNNTGSFPVYAGVTVVGNRASGSYGRGGGIFMYEGSEVVLANTILWGNTAAYGRDIIFANGSAGSTKVYLYNNVIQDGIPAGYTSGMVTNSIAGGGFYTDGSTGNITFYFSSTIAVDPALGALADNGGGIPTHAIPVSSSAVNKGLHMKIDGSTVYYSAEGSSWYSDPGMTTSATPSASAIDLTASDATGHERSGRPDIGAYEAR